MGVSIWWEPDPKHPDGGRWFIGNQGYVDLAEAVEVAKFVEKTRERRVEEFIARSIFEWVMQP